MERIELIRRRIVRAAVLSLSFAVVFNGASSNLVDADTPNIVIIMADDLGFSDLGCYGSEISTPAIDSLASEGIVFSDFHTAATCSPTRAMLLTGVDHHRAGMGNMYEFLRSAPAQIGKPGYEGFLNDSVVTIADVLRSAGYHTALSGKWHLGRQLALPQSPFANGFDQSWVLWSGWAAHYAPSRRQTFVAGNQVVTYPKGRYSTEHYTDKAIEFADTAIDQDKPFFLFASYTAPHWPLEAPVELMAQQKGNYDDGFETLRRRRIAGLIQKGIIRKGIRPAALPVRRPPLQHRPAIEAMRRWDDLDRSERVYYARLMEVHAAMIQSLDRNIGRLLDHLRKRSQYQNSLIIFLSDNGAAPMTSSASTPGNQLENVGRPGSFVGFGPEWASASSGPLRLMKGHATEGGTRVPAIIKLPFRDRHRVSSSFASVLDIAPTVYQVTGATYPKMANGQELVDLQGSTMFAHLKGESESVHDDNYSMGWELFGRTAFRRGKWKITWIEKPFGTGDFELFDIENDPGETENLRATYPERYRRMLDGFEDYARTNGIVVARPKDWE